MPIISVGIIKIMDEREKCDTRCVEMRQSKSEGKSRQYNMLIISVRDNKIIDEKETQTEKITTTTTTKQQNKTKKKKKKTEKNKLCGSQSERVRAKCFCCAFKLGFNV